MDLTVTNLKQAATELAALIADKSNDQNKIEDFKALLNLKNTDDISTPVEQKSDNVGIYKPKLINGEKYFVRDEEMKQFYTAWPKVDAIAPKEKGENRIILFGESVARGLFYEPYYSPAKVLEEILQNCYSNNIKVIDMAVSSIGAYQLLDLCEQSLVLQPDIFVVFAGNNWNGTGTTEENLQSIKQCFNEPFVNYDSVKSIIEKATMNFVDDFFKRLSKLVKEKNIPVLFIIPEYNLLDYKTTLSQKDVSFIDLNTREWIETKKKAENALSNDDFVALSHFAAELCKFNPLHPLGYELLAEIKFSENKIDEARTLFDLARSCAKYTFKKTTPGIDYISRNAILTSCSKYNIPTVNLQEVFKEHLNGGIPDRHLFLDYCHLTVEGIKLSMSSTANELVKMWTGDQLSKETRDKYSVVTEPIVLSAAHFSAALHNAHWGQGYEIVSYHCKQSLAHHQEAVKAMTSYLDMITRKAPWLVNKKTEYLNKSNFGKQISGGINTELESFKFNDFIFVESILDALKSKGKNLAYDITNLRNKEYGIKRKKTDLLQTYYLPSTFDKLLIFNFGSAAFYVENNSTSRFIFCANEGQIVEINLTYRAPKSLIDMDKIILCINNKVIESLKVKSQWINVKLEIPSFYLKDGVNILSLSWPIPKKDIIQKNGDLLNELIKSVNPSWGEIHSLYVNAK
jgi:hypothetical protein